MGAMVDESPALESPADSWVQHEANKGSTWQWWVKVQFRSPASLFEWWWRAVGTSVAYEGALLHSGTGFLRHHRMERLAGFINRGLHLDNPDWDYTSRMGWPRGLAANLVFLPLALVLSPVVWGLGLLAMCLFKDNLVYGGVPHPISTSLPESLTAGLTPEGVAECSPPAIAGRSTPGLRPASDSPAPDAVGARPVVDTGKMINGSDAVAIMGRTALQEAQSVRSPEAGASALFSGAARATRLSSPVRAATGHGRGLE